MLLASNIIKYVVTRMVYIGLPIGILYVLFFFIDKLNMHNSYGVIPLALAGVVVWYFVDRFIESLFKHWTVPGLDRSGQIKFMLVQSLSMGIALAIITILYIGSPGEANIYVLGFGLWVAIMVEYIRWKKIFKEDNDGNEKPDQE